jgi:hypothetical protein
MLSKQASLIYFMISSINTKIFSSINYNNNKFKIIQHSTKLIKYQGQQMMNKKATQTRNNSNKDFLH